MKKLALVIIISVATIISMSGCNSNSITGDKFNSLNKSIVMTNGYTYTDYEDAVETFVTKMYSPAGLTDMATEAYQMKQLTDENEFEKLIKEFKFKEGAQRTIKDFETSFGKEQFTENGVNKFMVYFTVDTDGILQSKALELYLNSSGLIYKHEIWTDNSEGMGNTR